jgi:hypothetical protein
MSGWIPVMFMTRVRLQAGTCMVISGGGPCVEGCNLVSKTVLSL